MFGALNLNARQTARCALQIENRVKPIAAMSALPKRVPFIGLLCLRRH
jgi:hypothetical protein